MKTLRHIEVEPLSAQRWAKIERAAFAQLEVCGQADVVRAEPRRRESVMTPWLLAAALGALAVIAFAIRGLPGHPVIDPPSRISTGTSSSHLALPGISLDVEPHSAVVVEAETPRGLLVVLDRGTIVCEVAPRSREAPVIVQAGATRVRVLGTRFSVTRFGEAAHIKVQRGVVEVTSRGESRRVAAGEQWPPIVAQKPVESSWTHPEALSSSETLPSSEGAPPRPPESVGRAFPEKVVTGGRPRPSPAPQKDASEDRAAVPEPERTVIEPQPSRQAVFEQATALERTDPARASELYRSLESRADSWAQNALFARARLAASRGKGGEGRRLLEQYLERFPRGSNAEDARALLRRIR